MNVTIPGARAWPACPREFYTFFQQLASGANTGGVNLAGITQRLSAVEAAQADPQKGQVRGTQSVQSIGVLPNFVSLTLVNDTLAPGNGYVYGTDGTGAKGWRSTASMLASTDDVTLTVGNDGISTMGLADLADSGTGAALCKITRDSKGRISGTSAATTTDLSEGTNLYFTDTRAYTATKAMLLAGTNVTITADDVAQTLTIAATGGGGVQSVTGTAVDNTDPLNPVINSTGGGGGHSPTPDYGSDPHFDKVIFLTQCHTPYFWPTDACGSIIAPGSAAFSNKVPRFGNASLAVSRTTQHPSVIPDSRWDLGTGDFTIEAMVYPDLLAASYWPNILGRLVANNNKQSFNLYFNELSGISFDVSTTGSSAASAASAAVSVTPNAWHEIAVVRESGAVTIFLDGQAVGSGTFSGAIYHDTTTPCFIGQGSSAIDKNNTLSGYVAAARITKGLARYSSAYTPATSPWPNHA